MNQLRVVELLQHACHPQHRENLESRILLQSPWQFFPSLVRLLETTKYGKYHILVQTNFGFDYYNLLFEFYYVQERGPGEGSDPAVDAEVRSPSFHSLTPSSPSSDVTSNRIATLKTFSRKRKMSPNHAVLSLVKDRLQDLGK